MTPPVPVLQTFLPGQAEQVVALLQQATGRWSGFASERLAIEHWTWKHQDGPQGPSFVSLAVAEDRIAGALHSIPLRFKIRDRFVRVTYDSDLAVLPRYRRRGLYYKLAEYSEALRNGKGIEYCYWVTRNPFMARVYKRRFDRLPLEFAKFVKISNVRKHLRMRPTNNPLFKLLGYRLLDARNRLRNTGGSVSPSASLSISKLTSFDHRVDAFWAAAAHPFTLIGERDRAFLNWRFMDRRAGAFSVWIALEDGRIVAFVAVKTEGSDSRYQEGYIADLLALPGRRDAAEALVLHALDHFRRRHINAIHCMLPTTSPYATVLMRCGFVDTRSRNMVFLKFLKNDHVDPRGVGIGSSGRHHLSYADVDLI